MSRVQRVPGRARDDRRRLEGDDSAGQADHVLELRCRGRRRPPSMLRRHARAAAARGSGSTCIFPSCWDGKSLDSADHKSHMAYPTAGAARRTIRSRCRRSRSSTATRSPAATSFALVVGRRLLGPRRLLQRLEPERADAARHRLPERPAPLRTGCLSSPLRDTRGDERPAPAAGLSLTRSGGRWWRAPRGASRHLSKKVADRRRGL